MKNIRTKGKNKISLILKICILFLLAILPLYFYSVFIINTVRDNARSSLEEASNSKLSLFMNSMENELFNVMKMENRLLNDKNINYFSRKKSFNGTFQERDYVFSIQDNLEQLVSLSKYIVEASVYLPSINKSITSNQFNDMTNEEFNKINKVAINNNYPFTNLDDKILILVTSYNFGDITKKDYKAPFVISVEISKDIIKSELNKYFTANGGGAFLTSELHGMNIYDNDRLRLNKTIRKQLLNEDYEFSNPIKLNITSNRKSYNVYFKDSKMLNTLLIVYEPIEHIISLLGVYKKWTVAITILTLFLIILFSLWVRSMVVKPLNKLIDAFNSLDEGNLNISVKYKRNNEFGYLYNKFNKMCEKLGVLVKENYEEKIRIKNSELKQLQYQINPHFLYNSFFLVYRMAKAKDLDSVIRLTQHLGNYYQFVTRGADDNVYLNKEVGHAKEYLEIQNFRFKNRIVTYIEEIPDEYENIMVPRLILQPLIENAYNYGLKNKLSNGLIRILFRLKEKLLVITVEDNGDELDEELLIELKDKLLCEDRDIENTGILNVHKRLKIKFGDSGGLTLSRSGLGGLKVDINIAVGDDI